MIKKLLRKDPRERLKIVEIKNHKYFEDFKNQYHKISNNDSGMKVRNELMMRKMVQSLKKKIKILSNRSYSPSSLKR